MNRKLLLLLGLVLLGGTLGVYWPVGHCQFLNYDDDQYVVNNPMVCQGLSWPGLRWAFGSLQEYNWHPVTWLSHMLDCQLYGLEAGPHHVTNLLLHCANVLLLFWLLVRLTGAVWPSALAAALFGWHPMHVESVAWVAERKDLLSAFFFLLTLLAYERYAARREGGGLRMEKAASEQKGAGKAHHASRITHHTSHITLRRLRLSPAGCYVLALVCFALGLMSKPMLVTLPFVLLLLDAWPLGRFELSNLKSQIPKLRSLLREKLPFFALAAASCIITYTAQSQGGAVAPLWGLSVAARLQNALLAYATYLLKFFWPGRLAVFYPLPASFPVWQVAGAGVVLGLVTGLATWQARARPWLAVGWLWFLGMLVPVIGLVQVGDQALANRYTYLPYIGLALALVWGVRGLLHSTRRRQAVAVGLGVVGLAAGLVQTRFELQFWQDSQRLFARAWAVTGDSFVVHGRLAAALAAQGNLEQAEQHYRAALALAPIVALTHNDLAVVLVQAGKAGEAEAQFREALRLDPQLVAAYDNLGQFLTQQHRLEEAAAVLEAALKVAPQNAPAHCKLGFVRALQGDLPKAVEEFKAGARLMPQDESIANMLAQLLLRADGPGAALDYFQAQARARPSDPLPLLVLARIYLDQHQPQEAVASLGRAVALAPRVPLYLNQLALVYATYPSPEIRNGPEAVRLAERACQLSGRQAPFLDTLSAAYAAAGRFSDAVRAAQEAQATALARQDLKTAEAAARKLEQYQSLK